MSFLSCGRQIRLMASCIRLLRTDPTCLKQSFVHFERYKKLPPTLADLIVDEVITEGVYHSVNADLLNLLDGRVDGARLIQVANKNTNGCSLANIVFQRSQRLSLPTGPRSSDGHSFDFSRTTFADVEGVVKGERDWWVRQEILTFLDENKFGRPSFEALLNLGMRATDPDPARVAASLVFSHSLSALTPYKDCHWAARLLLRNVGLIPYAGRPPSLIPGILIRREVRDALQLAAAIWRRSRVGGTARDPIEADY